MKMLDSLLVSSNARSRSVTAENVYGEKGKGGMARTDGSVQEEVKRIGQIPESAEKAARDLGRKWKVRPYINLPENGVTTLVDIDGPGCFRHLWITTSEKVLRDLILRCYWDNEIEPSVEVPLGDFFCNACGYTAEVRAIPVNVNPSNGMNCYFPMPFRKHAKITLENRCPERCAVYYAFNYEELDELPEDTPYFHAKFHRENPTAGTRDFTILDGVRGKGHFCGCYMTWQQNNSGWWGEGEFKAFLDGDTEFPTICGTGTEDYFGGAWGFGKTTFTSPFLGYPCGGDYKLGVRHSLYRFHILDPIHFQEDIRITMQTLGWRSEGRYLPLKDDLSATAYWYQGEPHLPFGPLQSRDELEII